MLEEASSGWCAHRRPISGIPDVAAEVVKLGESGRARIDAVTTALKGRLGDRANPLISGMVSAEQVEAEA